MQVPRQKLKFLTHWGLFGLFVAMQFPVSAKAQTPAELLSRGRWLLVAVCPKADSVERPLTFDQFPDSLKPALTFKADSLYRSTLDVMRGVNVPSHGWWWAEPSGYVLYTEKDFKHENQALIEIVYLSADRLELLPAQSPVRMIYRCAEPSDYLPENWRSARFGTRQP